MLLSAFPIYMAVFVHSHTNVHVHVTFAGSYNLIKVCEGTLVLVLCAVTQDLPWLIKVLLLS